MKIYIVVTKTETLGTDFAPIIDVYPFRTQKEAESFRAEFMYLPFELGVSHCAHIYEKEMK